MQDRASRTPTARRPDRAAVRRALSAVELFAGLGDAVLDELAATAMPRTYGRGRLMFSEGDPGTSLLVLTAGTVTIFRTSRGGERAVLTVMKPPEVLGELALIDGAPRSASAEASTPTEALLVGRDSFLALLHAQPALVDPMLRHLGAMVRRLSDQAADHVFLDLGGRVAKVLVRLSTAEPRRAALGVGHGLDGTGRRDGGSPRPAERVVELSQSRLAEMAGGSRQSVNQVLGVFAARGLVRVENRRVVISDLEGLSRRAGMEAAEPPRSRPGAGWSLSAHRPLT